MLRPVTTAPISLITQATTEFTTTANLQALSVDNLLEHIKTEITDHPEKADSFISILEEKINSLKSTKPSLFKNKQTIFHPDVLRHINSNDIDTSCDELSEKKHPHAIYQLALLCRELEKHEAVFTFLTIASKHECPNARAEIGMMYFNGDECYKVKEDKTRGESLLLEAVELGSKKAKMALQDIYLRGDGQGAFDYFSKGQEKNDPDAIFALSTLYEKGIGGVQKNSYKSHTLLDDASKAGSAEASFKVAQGTDKNLMNNFVTQNDPENHKAYVYLVKAAEKGHRAANYILGKAYAHLAERYHTAEEKEQQTNHVTKARNYLTQAESLGYKDATDDLKRLKNRFG